MKHPYLDHLVPDLNRSTERMEAMVRHLSPTQLNWKPRSNKWSVAECMDHLATTNHAFFPILQEFATSYYEMDLWCKYSPFSNFFGWFYIKTRGPKFPLPLQTPMIFHPLIGTFPPSIVDRYFATKAELMQNVYRIDLVHFHQHRIPSPVTTFITYSVKDALTIIQVHEARHVNQIEKLIKHRRFPKA